MGYRRHGHGGVQSGGLGPSGVQWLVPDSGVGPFLADPALLQQRHCTELSQTPQPGLIAVRLPYRPHDTAGCHTVPECALHAKIVSTWLHTHSTPIQSCWPPADACQRTHVASQLSPDTLAHQPRHSRTYREVGRNLLPHVAPGGTFVVHDLHGQPLRICQRPALCFAGHIHLCSAPSFRKHMTMGAVCTGTVGC